MSNDGFTKEQREAFNKLWRFVVTLHPTLSEPGAKLACWAAIEWFTKNPSAARVLTKPARANRANRAFEG